tara:strand:- start:58648 stop:58905 length:258 start_codon:yes stop_codon:yes gene_type:complete
VQSSDLNHVNVISKIFYEHSIQKQGVLSEKEIIKLVTQGLTNTQMGERLFTSPKTVDTHRTNIMKKVGVHNVAGLIRFAFQNGIN